jgi:uncharacterized membrane protein YidH (DUF202 family)
MFLAQATTDQSSAWFALAGALGGVFLTSVAAIATAVINHRWQREEKSEDFRQERARLMRQERLDIGTMLGNPYEEF